ncbi:MAG: glycoside hydrolase family 3 N-terminal domain-containing protein [Actinomycetes bacterium]|nr:beta-glucosidase [Acidimicrobiia bacterium]
MTVEPSPQHRYQDASAPIEERVASLLELMTIEEKIAQLGSAWVFEVVKDNHLSPADAERILSKGIGHITRVSGASNLRPAEAARVANEIQRYLVEETRLGIPAIIHEEVCSGLMARGATVFPQAIGVASTWEPALAEAMGAAIRAEMLAVGARQGLAPVLDVTRDPRWGRTEETFGEDPHLVASMGAAFVRGLQGADLSSGVVATAKHFVGYGASEGGLNWAPAHIPPRELHDVYLHPFRAAVDAGLRSVMPSYQELDGVPASADRDLIQGLLRDEWGFEGTVVSDYFAVRQLETYHRVAPDGPSAAALALETGIDVELPGTDCYGEPLLEALSAGLVTEELVDRAVARVLRTKFELGLFEKPYVDEGADFTYPRHSELARDIARKSIVLLKNDGILPLRAAKVAVIGPNADASRHLFGDYTHPAHVESLREMKAGENVFHIPIPPDLDLPTADAEAATVFEALASRLDGQVAFARGCDVNGESREGFAEAVALASRSDVAVLVMGDKSGLTDDSTSGESRDRSSLDLPGVQEELVRAVIGTGTPVVLVLVGGRPMGSEWIHEHAAAVVMAWLPGAEGGEAIAEVLTGAYNPGGKLPISYPRSVGQIPVYHSHKVSGGRSHWKGDYVDSPTSPLYPFGHGLSYTQFRIEGATVEPDTVDMDGSVTVSARIRNVGDRDGEEVVQVYVRDVEASLTRPVSELKAFARVAVPAGGIREVAFTLPTGQLGFHDRRLDYVVEPGVFEVYVGRSAADRELAGTFTIADGGRSPEVAFGGRVTIRSIEEEED